MSNNLLFITLVAMALFDISTYVFVVIRLNKMQEALKDIADNQFDAKQVMELYEKKNTRPIVYESRGGYKATKI